MNCGAARVASLAVMAVALIACGAPGDPAQRVVAYIGDEPLTVAELQLYFRANLVGVEGGATGSTEELERVKSRLFDQFVEERLLLAEADRAGIQVGDDEVEAYLAPHPADSSGDPEGTGYARLAARRRIKLEKLHESAQREPVDEQEILRYVELHRSALDPGKRLELRTLQLPSLEDAQKVQREIRRRRMTFDEAVVLYEQDPVSGAPVQMGWEALPPHVREILDGIKPGQISPPVEMNGNLYLFRVESWLEDPEHTEAELERKARRLLEHRRSEQVHAELVARARKSIPVRIFTRRLPFVYRGRKESPAEKPDVGPLAG